MINRLIILMTVCLMSFSAMANANSSETKEGDNLPPRVIETDNVKYAGIMLKLDKNPTITARQETAISREVKTWDSRDLRLHASRTRADPSQCRICLTATLIL